MRKTELQRAIEGFELDVAEKRRQVEALEFVIAKLREQQANTKAARGLKTDE